MSDRYRWNGTTEHWEFYEPGFGGWTILRASPSSKSAPMTFAAGMRYIILHPLARDRERETGWFHERLDSLTFEYVSPVKAR